MILSNIKQFLAKNKKIFYYLGFFLIVFSLTSDSTFAATTDPNFEEIKSTVVMFAEGFLKGISVLLALITFLATIFLSPEWINGSLFGLNSHFKDVWILVSNLVYFAFAFILIWIAFMNIIGKSSDQYQLKQALPKFIVGVLIVPFSWFLVQFILSISAILTVSALSLPFDTFDSFKTGLSDVKIPKQCTVDLTALGKEGESSSFVNCPKENTEDLVKIFESGNAIDSIYGLISMYTYGILSFDTIGSVDKLDFKSITNFGDLIVKILFDVLFVLIYSILMVALGMVLMIRGIYIWIYTMMSPIFGLMYFFDKKEGGEGFFGKFNVKEFIALAMVPVYTMLALSFGLLFIYVVGTGLTTNTLTSSVKINESKTDSTGNQNSEVVIGGKFSLIIVGAAAKEENITNFLKKAGGGALGVVGSLILKVFGIVVLRGTVMAAMRSSEITKQITQPLHDFGSQVGKIVASAPGNTPIFGGQSMKSMGTIAGKTQSYIDSKQVDKAGAFVGKHMSFMDNQSVAKTSAMDKISSRLNNESMGGQEHASMLKNILKEMGSVNSIIGNKSAQGALSTLAKKVNVDDKDIKAFDFGTKDGIAKVVRVIDSKLDGSGHSVIEGRNDSQFNGNKLEEFMKSIGGTSDTNSSSNVNKNKVEPVSMKFINDKADEYQINVDDNTVVQVKQGKLEKLHYADLARHIESGSFTENEFKDLLSNMKMGDDKKFTKKFNDYFEIDEQTKKYKLKEGQKLTDF